jgi:hypothetical protein
MARSLVALTLLAILPCFSYSQEPSRTSQRVHVVVKGETLWELAQVYLGNPFRWPLIHQANRDRIQDPDLIYPGQEFSIPEVQGAAVGIQQVTVAPAGAPVEEMEAPVPARADPNRPRPRTVFYPEPVARVQTAAFQPSGPGGSESMFAVRTLTVPPGLAYAAEWLEPPGEEDRSIGRVELASEPSEPGILELRARIGEEVRLELGEDLGLRSGDLLQTYRPVRWDRKIGTVQKPTGILVVWEVADSGVTALVSQEFHRLQNGDRLRLVPEDLPAPGVVPVPVTSNVEGRILDFAEHRNLQGFGVRAFLDVGSAQGVSVGDVFRVLGRDATSEKARLQVVRVAQNVATGRVIDLMSADLSTGDRVQLVAKIR